jgi:Cupin superfamily protein
MPDHEFNLAMLLGPVEVANFFRTSWEKEPLVVARGQPDHYAGLLSMADIDDLIYFSEPGEADIQVIKTKKPAPGKTRSASPLPGPRSAHPAVHGAELVHLGQEYGQGKTIRVRYCQRRWRAVACLCRNLEAAFHCPINATLYLTPPDSQGLDAHFGAHDVFIVQLHGSKQWRLYRPVVALPLPGLDTPVGSEPLGPALQEIKLQRGDLLYIPRGHVHEAFTADEPSLHLTIGVKAFRWADVLCQAVKAAARHDVRLRQAVAPDYLTNGSESVALKKRFRELLNSLAGSASWEEACAGLGDLFFEQSLPALPDGRFAWQHEVRPITLDTVLEKRPGSICRVIETDEAADIQFPGNRISGPRRIAAALHFIAAAGQFAVRALPDSLSDNSKLVLARRLVREGLLRIV